MITAHEKDDGLTVQLPHRRGNYVSRIEGPDPKWLARRKKVKAVVHDKTAIYRLETPGFYEIQKAGGREWIASTGSTVETLHSFKVSYCGECRATEGVD